MLQYKRNERTTLYSHFKSESDYLEMLEAAVHMSGVGFLIADKDGKVIKVNQSQVEITHQEPEYNVGRNMRDVQIEDGSPSATIKAIDTKSAVKLEQRLSNGRSYLVYTNPYFGQDGELKYVISNLLDTTEINNTMESIREDNQRLSLQLSELQNQRDLQNFVIHQSPIMRRLILLCDKVAQFDSSLLIQGESGVGKERIAEYIFSKSSRRMKPFIKINCAAIPEQLLESELFGYAPGAFTGADPKGKRGLLEHGDGGTLLFDEISELALPLQSKLLRFLQDGEFYRVGDIRPVHSDVRLIALTNKNLQDLVKADLFREDLFYRLNVIPIHVPSLRDRIGDIPLLIGYFALKFNQKYGLTKSFDIKAVSFLSSLPYKGNVRELQNTVERIFVLSEGDLITENQVAKIVEGVTHEAAPDIKWPEQLASATLWEIMQKYEEKVLREYMDKYGTEERVSKALKVSQSTISRKLAKAKRLANIQ